MKVLKFGGAALDSATHILNLKSIVEKDAQHQPIVVVVSALEEVTDLLLDTAGLAEAGDVAWRMTFENIILRHRQIIDAIFEDMEMRTHIHAHVHALFQELQSIYFGVYLIHDLTVKTQNVIVSYGERISSLIITGLIPSATWLDARQCIKTVHVNGRDALDDELTYGLVQDAYRPETQITVVPGFISSDRDSGDITNLGRGGSDYTAAILAAALNATSLEIWTDIDGFMTADPTVVHAAYAIEELSYMEAMELSHFGAKVIYPPTIYPVCIKDIPIQIKNILKPEQCGTVIRKETQRSHRSIKGMSSISGTTLITVSGLSMVGVIGVNRRIFTVLAQHGISVFLVSQASSENSTSIGVRDEDAAAAGKVLNEEFKTEIEDGSMFPVRTVSDLATIAIVGENMKNTPGIAGKLFETLGRSGISVKTCAQGASETNVSVVIDGLYLRKALNVLHDSFFLSEYTVLNLFICGIGTIGSKLIEQIKQQYTALQNNARLKLNVIGISSSRKAIFDTNGIPLADFRSMLEQAPDGSAVGFYKQVVRLNLYNSVFVDCTASAEIANQYLELLRHNVSVVAANKIAASSSFDTYMHLKDMALKRGVKFLFETNVGAGLPIIGTINDLRRSGDKIWRIEAVLSGTLNYIFNTLSEDIPFSQTVRQAVEQGYAEPDPRIDLSGMDVIRKLVILTREAGYTIEQEDVEKHLFIPETYFEGSLNTFWERLPLLDEAFERQRKALAAEGRRWRFVATMEGGKAKVALQTVDASHPFYNLAGSNNIVLLTTTRYKEYPMLIQGYGAGADVTAAGVFANIMSVANV